MPASKMVTSQTGVTLANSNPPAPRNEAQTMYAVNVTRAHAFASLGLRVSVVSSALASKNLQYLVEVASSVAGGYRKPD